MSSIDSQVLTPGGHSVGNFPNYYEFNKPDERLDIILPKLFEKGEISQPVRILDVGCNDGSLSFRLYERLKEQGISAKIIGFDIDSRLIDRANAKKEELGLTDDHILFFTLNFMEVEARDARLPPIQTFDLILVLSITMWIQLQYGRHGLQEFLMALFQRRHTPLGIVIVEPQPWKCYRSALKRLRHLKSPLPSHHSELKSIGAHDPAVYIRSIIQEAHPELHLFILGQTQWDRYIFWYQSQ